MSEAVMDSDLDVGTPSEAPATEDTQFDLGADLDVQDTPDEALTSDASDTPNQRQSTRSNETGEAPAFDPDNTDWLRVDVNTVPDEYKPLAHVAKNMQRQFTASQQEAAQLRQAAQEERQQYLQALQGLRSAANPQQEQGDYMQELSAHLSEEEQRGLQVVRALTQRELQPLQQTIAQQNQLIQQQQQQLQQFNGFITNQRRQSVVQEIQDAKSQYGEAVEQFAPQIAALKQTPNPQTGQPYTVREAYEMVAGVAAQQADQARATDRQVRANSKRNARPRNSAPDVSDEGPLTDTELLSQMHNLGFE